MAKIYVTGDISSGITVDPGAKLEIYFAGNFDMRASRIENLNEKADHLRINGINPPAGQSRSIDIGPERGPSTNYAVWNAPGHDFQARGSRTHFVGSVIAKTLTSQGEKLIHFDESLATAGTITDYQRGSWVEDER